MLPKDSAKLAEGVQVLLREKIACFALRNSVGLLWYFQNHLKEVNQTEGLRSHVEQAIEKYMATEKPHYPKKEARHPLPERLET